MNIREVARNACANLRVNFLMLNVNLKSSTHASTQKRFVCQKNPSRIGFKRKRFWPFLQYLSEIHQSAKLFPSINSQVNGKCLKGLFHEEVVASLKNLPVKVTLVCGRKCNGPSPIRGTIVDNVDPSHSEKAFESRVRGKCLLD